MNIKQNCIGKFTFVPELVEGGALYLSVFEQPASGTFFINLLVILR